GLRQPGGPAVLERGIDPARGPAHTTAQILEQADPLAGDRGADLRRLRNPLDQLLGLVALEDLVPDAVRCIGLEQPLGRPSRGVAVERPLHTALSPPAQPNPSGHTPPPPP